MTTIAIIGTGNVGSAVGAGGGQGGLRRRVRRPGRRQGRGRRRGRRRVRGRRRRARRSPARTSSCSPCPTPRSRRSRARSRRSPRARSSSTRPTRSRPTTPGSPPPRAPRAPRRSPPLLPDAKVVKAFNTLFATNTANPAAHGTQLDSLFATDDEAAKDAVCGLSGSIGFRPVHVGPLAASRELEAMAWLNIRMQMLTRRQLEHRVRDGRPARGGAHLRPLSGARPGPALTRSIACASTSVGASRIADARIMAHVRLRRVGHACRCTSDTNCVHASGARRYCSTDAETRRDRRRATPDPSGRCRPCTSGHGAPPLLDDPLWMGAARGLVGATCRGPTSILIVSAHWQTAPMAIGATTTVPLVYDFYGFPQRYYEYEYRSPGAPELAASVKALMPANEPVLDRPTRGLDHGAWVPLHGDVPRRRHPGPPDVDARPRPRAPVRGRPAARAAARRGRADRRLRVHDPRPAVHRRVLRRQAGRAAVVGRVRPLGGRGARRAATSTRCSRSARRRPACRSRTRPSSTSRRCS